MQCHAAQISDMWDWVYTLETETEIMIPFPLVSNFYIFDTETWMSLNIETIQVRGRDFSIIVIMTYVIQ